MECDGNNILKIVPNKMLYKNTFLQLLMSQDMSLKISICYF
jgi:hypothetical protein